MEVICGNIFESQLSTLVNTVNCVGVMGAGIALEHKLRNPEMYDRYKQICNQGLLSPGKLWLWKGASASVLNFPTKIHWRNPSRIEFIEGGLRKFVDSYKDRGITSAAFPLLGAHNGGLDENQVLEMMVGFLEFCDIPIEIYQFNLVSADPLLNKLRNKVAAMSAYDLAESCAITKSAAGLVIRSVESADFKMISDLLKVKGISSSTVEKLYTFAQTEAGAEEARVRMH